METNKTDWISVKKRLPENAGFEVLVSALNKYQQRAEFIAFFGYNGSVSWYTYDVTKMRGKDDRDNAVSDAWTITHWKFLDRFPRPVELVPDSLRPKAEKFRCTGCGDFCYFPHGRIEISYKYCPNCGKEVKR